MQRTRRKATAYDGRAFAIFPLPPEPLMVLRNAPDLAAA